MEFIAWGVCVWVCACVCHWQPASLDAIMSSLIVVALKLIDVKINSAICLFKSNDDAKSLMILMNSDNTHADGMISRDLTNANHSIIIYVFAHSRYAFSICIRLNERHCYRRLFIAFKFFAYFNVKRKVSNRTKQILNAMISFFFSSNK